jgi:hypothetical protein
LAWILRFATARETQSKSQTDGETSLKVLLKDASKNRIDRFLDAVSNNYPLEIAVLSKATFRIAKF